MGFFNDAKNIPIIGAGLSLVGDLFGGIGARARTNREHAWQEQMYGWQRRDALADWQRETDYNSPTAQMARLRDAKLNPNLVYGNSVVQEAPAIRSSSPPGGGHEVPRGNMFQGVSSGLMDYYDIKLKEAQTDNVRQATTVSVQDAVLKAAQTIATLRSSEKTVGETKEIQTRLSRAQELVDISVDAAKASVNRTVAETGVMLSRNEREAAMNAQNIQESIARIGRMRIENLKTQAETARTEDERAKITAEITEIQGKIENLAYDASIKEQDLSLKKSGIQPHDPMYQRVVAELVQKMFGTIGKVWEARKSITPGGLINRR